MAAGQARVQAGLIPGFAGILRNDRVYREALRRVREEREREAQQKSGNRKDPAEREPSGNGQDERQQALDDTGSGG